MRTSNDASHDQAVKTLAALIGGIAKMADQDDAPVGFNTSDKSSESNGNLPIAMKKISDSKPDATWQNSKEISAEKLTKSPYSTLGKLCKISGVIYKVEELPPSEELPGSWSEVLLLANNPNSPLGSTTVECVFNGDTSDIRVRSKATCAGKESL